MKRNLPNSRILPKRDRNAELEREARRQAIRDDEYRRKRNYDELGSFSSEEGEGIFARSPASVPVELLAEGSDPERQPQEKQKRQLDRKNSSAWPVDSASDNEIAHSFDEGSDHEQQPQEQQQQQQQLDNSSSSSSSTAGTEAAAATGQQPEPESQPMEVPEQLALEVSSLADFGFEIDPYFLVATLPPGTGLADGNDEAHGEARDEQHFRQAAAPRVEVGFEA
jgi:hypothetical protein